MDVNPRCQRPCDADTTRPLGGRCTRFGNFGLPTGTRRQSSGAPVPRARRSVPSAATDARLAAASAKAMRVPVGDQTGRVPIGSMSWVTPSSTTSGAVPSSSCTS
jgi:hypothetical protein